MKNIHLLLPVALAATLGATPALAQRQQAVGPGTIPLSVAGSLSGVDMSSSGTTGTLAVGTLGGPQTDILSSNNPFVAGPVAVSTGASSQGNIVFNSSSTVYGDIGVTQPGGPFLLNIAAGQPNVAVVFRGSVFATTLDVMGTGSVSFDNGANNITVTNFAADGTINLAPNTTVIGALTTTAGADTGTLNLGGGSVLNGAVGGAIGLRAINVTGGSNLAGVSASITGTANAYTFSLGTNTLNVGGALTIANASPGGVINTTLASASVYGNIRTLGATNLGPTLLVNVLVPQSAVIAPGTQFNIIQTTTGTLQSGTNGTVVSVNNPTNPLYVFTATPAAGTIAGLVTITTADTPLTSIITPPSTPSTPLPPAQPVAAAVAPVLVALIPAAVPGSDIVNVLAPINALTSQGAVVAAVAQLAPSSASLATPLASFQLTRSFEDLWESRLESVLCAPTSADQTNRPDGTKSACDGGDGRGNWWMKGFGSTATQGTQQANAGYKTDSYGAMIGYDVPLGPNTRAGLGLGYAATAISQQGTASHTNADSYQASLYAGHRRGAWFVNGDLSYGWNNYQGSRIIAFPGVNRVAAATYSGEDYTAFVTTGLNIPVGGFTLTPLASLQYTRVNTNGYTETGAGSINLNVHSQGNDFLESGLGAKLSREFVQQDMLIVPEIHAKWLHELGNPLVTQTAAFETPGSASFSTSGIKPADDIFNIGAGITLLSCGCSHSPWSVQAVYDYYTSNASYAAHRGMIKVSMRF